MQIHTYIYEKTYIHMNTNSHMYLYLYTYKLENVKVMDLCDGLERIKKFQFPTLQQIWSTLSLLSLTVGNLLYVYIHFSNKYGDLTLSLSRLTVGNYFYHVFYIHYVKLCYRSRSFPFTTELTSPSLQMQGRAGQTL
jgi:hypothetical protein